MPTVVVQPGGHVVQLRPGENLLAGLYRAGYAYRIGCKRGGCGICKVDLLAGEVEYERAVADTVLSAQEQDGGTCLSCRAVPLGDVEIALRGDRLRVANPFLVALHRR